MMSQMAVIEIATNTTVDDGAGAHHTERTWHKVKASKQAIYEKSFNEATRDGQRITARFLVRHMHADLEQNAIMIRYRGREYKKFNILPKVGTLSAVIEIREVL